MVAQRKDVTETALSTIIVAITAFVAVSPCPVKSVDTATTCAFVIAILACWYFDMLGVAVSVCLAYIALALRVKTCSKTGKPERFTKHAVSRRSQEMAGPSETLQEVPTIDAESGYHKVFDVMQEEDLQAFVTPEHLASAQDNTVPT